MKKDLEPSPSPPNCSKYSSKLLLLLISVNWPSFVTYWVIVQKICPKMYPVSCTNTHHDFTDLVSHGMAKNTKIWISWERNTIFLQNKKISNLCLRWHIFRSYRFLAEVTFKASLVRQTSSFFKKFLSLPASEYWTSTMT